MATTKTDPLADILKKAEKKYGMLIGPMSEVAHDINTISTGNMALDIAMGSGVPMGRSLELYGPPSCGKTTMALQTAANLQQIIMNGGDDPRGIMPDDRIMYLDYEQAMDKDYAKALGLDTEHESFIFTQPDSLEDGANLVIDLVKTGRVRLFIFDSAAFMTPSAKAEAEIGKSLPAVQAKLMKDFLMTFTPLLYKNNATAIFLNHQMEKMEMGGSRPGMPTPHTTPGGAALKYVMSVRLQFTKIRDYKEDSVDPITGEVLSIPMSSDVRVKVVKNKVAPPFRQAVVRVRFGRGFDEFVTALLAMIAAKKIVYTAGYFYFHRLEEAGLAPEWMARKTSGNLAPYIKGEKNVYAMSDEHADWREAFIEYARDIVIENVKNGGKPVEEEEDSE
jgi:recombination protein RecA